MFGDVFYSSATILISVFAAEVYLFAYIKLKWEFLWIGFTGACFNCLSGFDFIYDSINYDNPEILDYLIDLMWIIGWSLEVLCLFLIIRKVVELQAQEQDNDPFSR